MYAVLDSRVINLVQSSGKTHLTALEALQARVGNGSVLHYVEDDYDDAVPVRNAMYDIYRCRQGMAD